MLSWGTPLPEASPVPLSLADLPQREAQHPLPRVGRALRGHAAALPPGIPLSATTAAATPHITAQCPGQARDPVTHGRPRVTRQGTDCGPGGARHPSIAAFTDPTTSSPFPVFSFLLFVFAPPLLVCLLVASWLPGQCQGPIPSGIAPGRPSPPKRGRPQPHRALEWPRPRRQDRLGEPGWKLGGPVPGPPLP